MRPALVEVEPQPQTSGRSRWPLRRLRGPFRISLALVAGVTALGAAYTAWKHYSIRESTDDAQIDGHVTPVSAKVGGTVSSVRVRDNQLVVAGDVLIVIDPRDYQVALDLAQAEVDAAEASAQSARASVAVIGATTASRVSMAEAARRGVRAALAAAQNEVEVARARLTASQASLKEAQANHEKASRDLDRMRQLVVRDEISRQQYDAILAAEAVARAEAEVQAAHSAPEEVAASLCQARASGERVRLAKAVATQAELNLEYTTVRAPVGGVVSSKTVEVGQVVKPGQPLLAVVPLNDVWVTANFKETQLNHVQPGQAAVVSVDAYGDRKYQAHVASVAGATGARFSLLPPENASGNYVKVVQRVPVKLVFDSPPDPEHPPRPGMSVEVTVITR